MKLINFSLYLEPHAIEIEAVGILWDLHNVADLTGITFAPIARRFAMNWCINRQYALRDYPAEEFQIEFRNVNRLEISTANPDLPATDETCLHSLSRIRPEDQMVPNPELIFQDQFDLLFEFESGRRIRIGAAEAEFAVAEAETV